MEATPKNLNDLKLKKANEDKIAQENLEKAKELAALIETKSVVVKMKAGENGKAFGAVSGKEIASALKEQHDIEVDKKKIQLADNIKNFGCYEVPVKLHPQVVGTIHVKVTEA